MHTAKRELTQGRDRRRKHTDEFKAAVVAECSRPGVSIARVELHHGLNANLLRRWVVSAGNNTKSVVCVEPQPRTTRTIEPVSPQFVTVPVEATARAPGALIEVELRRGPMIVKVSWPLSASAERGAWMRELLR